MKRNNDYLIGNKFAVGSTPNKTSFKKGSVPWNKGKKGLHLSPNTEFKKGQEAIIKYPIGTIRKRKGAKGKDRNFIKIAEPKVWMEYAKYLWIDKYGFLIPGDITHHLNGDSLDDRIENIIAMPRSHHPTYHGRWGLKEVPIQVIEIYKKRYAEMAEKRISQAGGLFTE